MSFWKNNPGRIISSAVYLICALCINSSIASDWSIPVGLVFEHNFYNQFGITASVANNNLLGGHPQATVSATTSRLRRAAGYNVLKNENYLLTCAWHFRPGTYIDPFTGIDIGFTHFSQGDDELSKQLKNTFMLFNVRVGITATFLDGRLRPLLDGGLAFSSFFPSTSTVFPLFWGVKICYDVTKGGRT